MMNLLANIPLEDDKLLWDISLSRYHLPTIAVADKLGIFACIDSGATTVGELANRLSIDTHATEAITCLLSSLHLLDKNYDFFTLTPVAKNYLLPSSPFYWGAAFSSAFSKIYESIEYKHILNSFLLDKLELISNGKNLQSMWEKGEIDFNSAVEFTKVMHSIILSSALKAVQKNVFKNTNHLLDVGGGSGCFSSAFVKNTPGRKATVFELPSVCEIAKNYLSQLQTSSLVTLHPGNFFHDPFPESADGILFSNIFHDWTFDKALFLAKKSYDYLPVGGKIFIHEMLLNDEKNGPLTPSVFNLLMYINFGSSQFNAREMFSLLEKAGFCNKKLINTTSYYSVIIAEKLE